MKKQFSRGVIIDLLDDLEPITKDNWRHGHTDIYVFEDPSEAGTFWRCSVQVHSDEGWQLPDEVTCLRVVPELQQIVVYVPWKADGAES